MSAARITLLVVAMIGLALIAASVAGYLSRTGGVVVAVVAVVLFLVLAVLRGPPGHGEPMSPKDEGRGPTRSESRLMIGFVIPVALGGIAFAALLLVNGVWLPGLGFLVAGCVIGMAAMKVLRTGPWRRRSSNDR